MRAPLSRGGRRGAVRGLASRKRCPRGAAPSIHRERETTAGLGGPAAVSHADRVRAGREAAVLLRASSGVGLRPIGCGEPHSTIPRPDGRPTWFINVSAASRVGSQTNPSHGVPRRQIGTSEACDRLHLPRPERSPGSRAACALADIGSLPRIPAWIRCRPPAGQGVLPRVRTTVDPR